MPGGLERLTNKVCVITGAASGLAQVVAERLTREGATVVGVDKRVHRVGAHSRLADVTDEDQVRDLFASIKNDLGEVFAGKSVGEIADYVSQIIRGLDQKPAVLGHPFGGLLTQIVAGRGLARVSVAIDLAPFRGVLPLPYSLVKSTSAVWRNPANHHRAVPLTYQQFRYGFANAVSEEEPPQLMRPTPYRARARPSFRPRRRTSTPGPRPRSIPTTPIADRF
jgi:hypothetical protein